MSLLRWVLAQLVPDERWERVAPLFTRLRDRGAPQAQTLQLPIAAHFFQVRC